MNGLVIGGVVSLALGAVGLGFGIGFGVDASNRSRDLDGRCVAADNGKACPLGSQSDIDAMQRAATVSTVGFVLVGAALGLGAILTGVGAAGSSPESVALDVGPGWLGVRGTFQ